MSVVVQCRRHHVVDAALLLRELSALVIVIVGQVKPENTMTKNLNVLFAYVQEENKPAG